MAGLDILVIEDEALRRKQIAAHLEPLGAEVTGVGTLEAARQALVVFGFDFALLDVNLPDGRGTDLLADFLQQLMSGATPNAECMERVTTPRTPGDNEPFQSDLRVRRDKVRVT